MFVGAVHLRIADGIASVTFDRPDSRNAMTWAMYEQLEAICRQLHEDESVRAVRFQGAGGAAFVSGTDIPQFQAFTSGDHGVAYEKRIDTVVELVETLPMPTLAVVQGAAVGGGFAIATACDFRIATPGSRFGVPIARTLGNCLSSANVTRLVAAVGRPMAQRMLLLGDLLNAEELLASGYLLQVVAPQDLEAAAKSVCDRVASLAPITQRVSKETLNRLLHSGVPDVDDLIRRAYDSEDFREGVQAFMKKRPPVWQGR
ncbi:enoyl-CoA hydratase [Caenimonas sedimenti]|uniref:Enoyl-CoA hydratase n=1 Tax=Caenimonas sedimenti TaxID=2596921 RepID=A0A562ZSX8_9BURK|nr:enoyl-CoA hydratase/isomerase family protein [Caenimonas sedimenti]TWO71623.1 enoyl-CoA hydratase [Caenimonas sedimenti]